MKHILFLLLAATLLPSCKKDIDARTVIVKVYNSKALIKLEPHGDGLGTSARLDPGGVYKEDLPKDVGYTIIADGDSANLSLELIVNSRTVYHQTGKHHEVGL